jgi:hypothetical protein
VAWYSERSRRLDAETVPGLEVRATEIVKRGVTDNRLQVKVSVKVKGRVGVETEAALGLPDAGWL